MVLLGTYELLVPVGKFTVRMSMGLRVRVSPSAIYFMFINRLGKLVILVDNVFSADQTIGQEFERLSPHDS